MGDGRVRDVKKSERITQKTVMQWCPARGFACQVGAASQASAHTCFHTLPVLSWASPPLIAPLPPPNQHHRPALALHNGPNTRCLQAFLTSFPTLRRGQGSWAPCVPSPPQSGQPLGHTHSAFQTAPDLIPHLEARPGKLGALCGQPTTIRPELSGAQTG